MSHTATGEWKSFEIRMRHRRAERLVLRADVAAEAGCFEDSQTFLEEARALWPGVPGLADVQERIDSAAAAVAPAAQGSSRWKEIAAGATAVLSISAAAVIAVTTVRAPLPAHDVKAIVEPVPVRPVSDDASAIPDQRAAAGDEGSSQDSGIGNQRSVGIEEPLELKTAPLESETPIASGNGSPILVSRSPNMQPPPVIRDSRFSIESQTPIPAPRPPISDSRSPISDSAPAAAVAVPPVTIPDAATTSIPLPVVTAAAQPAPMQPAQEVLVRGALARYAKAYTDLDVDAAERVWPSVNRSALGHAFESLESQRVSLGDCRIDVDGSAAHASCAGSVTWTPKVGGRERTDDRSWTFDLEQSGVGWQITSARVQNR